LAKINETHRDDESSATHNLESAKKEFPSIKWSSLFNGLLESIFEDFSKYLDPFTINKSKLLKELDEYLAKLQSSPSSTKDLISYLLHKLLKDSDDSNFVTRSVGHVEPIDKRSRTDLLNNRLINVKKLPEDQCTEALSRYLPNIPDRLYIEYAFPRSHKKDLSTIADNVISAYEKSLANLKWLDQESKDRSQKKATNAKRKIGHPDYLVDDEKLDGLHSCLNKHVQATKSSDPLSLYKYIKMGLCSAGQKLRELDPIQIDDFLGVRIAEINAFFYQELNQMVVPAGILHSPLYRYDFPKAINYGAAGMIIGHELCHGFDQNGINFNFEGKRDTPILTPESRTEFNKMVQCVKTLYGKLGHTEFGLSQDIADSAGVKAAYRAFEVQEAMNGEEAPLPGLEKYTWDEIFFIAQAHVWCGNDRARVIGEMQNFDKFSEAFKCKKGDYMNPVDACDVW